MERKRESRLILFIIKCIMCTIRYVDANPSPKFSKLRINSRITESLEEKREEREKNQSKGRNSNSR